MLTHIILICSRNTNPAHVLLPLIVTEESSNYSPSCSVLLLPNPSSLPEYLHRFCSFSYIAYFGFLVFVIAVWMKCVFRLKVTG